MPFVVTENCTDCHFTDCVEVCPVTCFHTDGQRVYIDPIACIDCAACVPLCPVEAIFEDMDVPHESVSWIKINADKASTLPAIIAKQAPLEGAQARRVALGFAEK